MTTGPPAGMADEISMLRDLVRRFVDTELIPLEPAVMERGLRYGATAEPLIPPDAHAHLISRTRELDLFGIDVPSELGGHGYGAAFKIIALEELRRSIVPFVLPPDSPSLHMMIAACDEAQREKYVLPYARGEKRSAFALTEPEAGSDAAAMKTRAVKDGNTFILNGTKRWITNAGVSVFYTVMAVTDPAAGAGGISAFVVEKDDEGFSFGAPERTLGIQGSPTRELYFDNCVIPADRLIGEEGSGFRTALATLDHTRITIAAQALGIAQGALDYATGYVQERRQFGRPVSDFQGVQFMLADMAMKVAAARQLTYAAAARSERAMGGQRSADLTFMSSACKCFASDVAMEVTTDAVQLLGGYGYVKDYPVERMMRDAKITQIYEGTNQIQRVVMARQLLK